MKKIILLAVSLCSTATFAIDIEDNIKDFEKSKNWGSFSISDDFGRVVATRATTKDDRLNATLAVTYATNHQCKSPTIDVIVKVNEPTDREWHEYVFGNVQVNSQAPKRIKALMQSESESEFIFLSLNYNNFVADSSKGTELSINYKGFGLMEFSLDGFKKAINNAYTTCKNFSGAFEKQD